VITNPPPASTAVRFELDQVPYEKLSDYRFFTGTINELVPNERVLPYDVITPLFADYAKKKKFIWMPEGTSASYVMDSEILDFPEGTVMIKSFYYDRVQPNDDRRFLETRLIYLKDGEWLFADYLWNDEQTEAYLDMDGANVPISWIDEGNINRSTTFRIPSESECFTCHKVNNEAMPIGPKPQNLNRDFIYEEGSMNQLQKWMEVGYLENNLPPSIETVAKWDDASVSLHDRVRAYVDMNCAHCHRENSHCSYRELRFAWSETVEDYNLGICMEPAENLGEALTYVVASGNIERSVLHFRINSTNPAQRMPLLGRTLVHEEAVVLFEEWINSLSPPCP
jgi:uncharacterized repeat protein (TIGR03806 family)